MSEPTEKVVMGGQEFSLSDLAGLDVSGFANVEYGFTNLNKGGYRFRIVDAKLQKLGEDAAGIVITNEVVECSFAADDNGNPMDDHGKAGLIGKKQNITFFATSQKDTTQDEAGATFQKCVGQCKKFLQDCGYVAQGSLQSILDGAVGTEFAAMIRHARSRKDADKIYVNFVNVKGVPATQAAPAAAATPFGGLKTA